MKKIFTINLVALFLVLPMCSAAHYIVGYVEDAKDGTYANDHTIILWNPLIGIQDNLTDIVGPNGNSHANNVYMIDCELLQAGCDIDNNLTLKIINNGDNYISGETNVNVTGAGYDIVSNITINSPPNISFVSVDDFLTSPPDYIDLIPADTKEVTCSAIINEYDGEESITNVTGRFFDNIASGYYELEDNNNHYRNNSCYINYTYGSLNEVEVTCNFYVWYYANSQEWNCTIEAQDNFSINSSGSDTSFVNPLLALGVDSPIQFVLFEDQRISNESILDVTNYGNVKINLSLSGYGFTPEDGNAMNCTLGSIKNISIEYEKYNLTKSNPGILDLTQFITDYTNLSSVPKVNSFNLNYRQEDSFNEAVNSTYWRVYVPEEISGDCQGNIVFGATQAPEE